MAVTTPKRGTELSTIDVCMIVVTTKEDTPRCVASNNQTKLSVEPQITETEPVKNIVKGVLKAQKKGMKTVTGNKITLTDNTTILELLEIIDGGKLTKDEDQTTITGYTPPAVGVDYAPIPFTLDAYSAVMGAGGTVLKYEKISYPGCTGSPIGLGSEDDVFRVNEYVIDSAPEKGEAPYTLTYVEELPEVGE